MSSLWPPSFTAWLDELGVRALTEPHLRTIGLWGQGCLPDDVREADRAVGYLDLAIAFFHLDDLRGDEATRAYDEVEALLADPGRDVPAGPAVAAYRALVRKVAERGAGLDAYLAGRRALVSAYRVRAELASGRRTCSFAEYAELRMTTIYVEQWLQLWQILEGRVLAAGDPRRAAVDAAGQALTRWHALANELVSVERDARAGVPNLVLLLAEERRLSLAEAAAELAGLVAGTERQLATACTALRDDPRPAVARHLALIDITYRGAVAHYATRRDPARYQAYDLAVLRRGPAPGG